MPSNHLTNPSVSNAQLLPNVGQSCDCVLVIFQLCFNCLIKGVELRLNCAQLPELFFLDTMFC